MKKFIITANLVFILALVPAVIVGYLHEDSKKDSKESTEVVKDAGIRQEEGFTFRLIKTF